MATLTPTLPSFGIGDDPWADDDYRGEFCPPDREWDPNSAWTARSRLTHALKQTGCVEVWADALGARVVLSLPDAPEYDTESKPPAEFDAADVADALQVVRAHRAGLGIRVLPEAGVLSASISSTSGFTGAWPECFDYDHPEHKAVADAIRYIDLDVGPQYGAAVCDQDAKLDGAETIFAPVNPETLLGANLVVFVPGAEHRLGPYVKNYGWLSGTYAFSASMNHYWRAFG